MVESTDAVLAEFYEARLQGRNFLVYLSCRCSLIFFSGRGDIIDSKAYLSSYYLCLTNKHAIGGMELSVQAALGYITTLNPYVDISHTGVGPLPGADL